MGWASDWASDWAYDHQNDVDAHHTKYTDAEARAATDGQIDADTVDGAHLVDIQNEIDGDISTHAGDADAHHSRYTDSEAVSAVNADADHGSTAQHDYFSGSHNDLTNVGTDDHHSRYTDSEAVSAVAAADDYVKNTGDTMSGNLNMNGNNLQLNGTDTYIEDDSGTMKLHIPTGGEVWIVVG